MSSVNNVQIVPVNVYWRMEQTETWDFTGKTKAGLDGKAFKFYDALDATPRAVWFDGTGSTSTPSLTGFTATKIDIHTGNTTPAQIATTVAGVVTALSGFDATASGAIVTVKRTDYGAATESFDAVGLETGLAYSLTRRGRDYDLGLIEGDVQLDFKPSNFLLTAHQYGKTPIAALNQGFDKLECGTTLLETQKSQLKELYTIYGGSYTPGAGSEVYGVGSISQGKNMMVEAGRLILKPVNANDDTGNFNLMLAIPVPDSLTFSGENPRKLKLSWQGFVDRDFNSKFNAIAIGDVGQDGL
jgi:hypothetical protein